MIFDCLVVGAGLAGATVAERLADAGKRVLVVERRQHIGGNAYDTYDASGILIHLYGPHIFHTNDQRVFDYLSIFTEWRHYEHRVLASVEGQLVPIPINRDTLNALYGTNMTCEEAGLFLAEKAEPIKDPKNARDVFVAAVGEDLYHKFFQGYTKKQWGVDPSELDASVAARVPTRCSRDDRYFTDKFQGVPSAGYTKMVAEMLDHPNIKLMLNTDYSEVAEWISHRHLVYSGRIDELFGNRYGPLPYRSLRFVFKTLDVPQAQSVGTVNYPNEHRHTRVTEFKHLTGQEHPKTTVAFEYPMAQGEPYYPVPRWENQQLYAEYLELAERRADLSMIGRLGTYRYYNMDQVVAQALDTAEVLLGRR